MAIAFSRKKMPSSLGPSEDSVEIRGLGDGLGLGDILYSSCQAKNIEL